MADGIKVQITRDGIPLSRIRQNFEASVEQALNEIGASFVKHAQLNAAIDTGDLRKSMRYKVHRSAFSPKVEVSANTDYAFKVHEKHEPAPGATFGRGQRTRAQPVQPEGIPGGTYFSRVAFYRAAEWRLHSAKLIAAALGGKKARVIVL